MLEYWGRFSSPIDVRLLEDGRHNEMLLDLTYTDPATKVWEVRKGFVSDGASIPQAFWSFVGGPWDGPYRIPAIVHDRYCEPPYVETSFAVHRMFHDACRAAGVGAAKAKLLYYAVRLGGPHWGEDALSPLDLQVAQVRAGVDVPSSVAPEDVARWIDLVDPSLEDIDFAVRARS